MQTVLGSGGVIGNELAIQLKNYTDKIRLVARHPVQVTGSEELVSADLTDRDQTGKAIEGSEIVFLTAGLPYKTKIWQEAWPKIMINVINGCRKHSTKLVFFDNVYAYGRVEGWMTEETPHKPISKKGEVRARIADQLIQAIEQGSITALIARSADFYGSNASNTFIQPMVFDKLRDGKKASWLGKDDKLHSFTYTPDAAKATALLGNTYDAYNQIWHLPTHNEVMTGKQFIEMVASAYGAKPKYSVLSKSMVRFAGLFNPLAKESFEMMYQQEYDYLFSSSKFEEKFFTPRPYADGIREIVNSTK